MSAAGNVPKKEKRSLIKDMWSKFTGLSDIKKILICSCVFAAAALIVLTGVLIVKSFGTASQDARSSWNWIVEPSIEADNIDSLGRGQWRYSEKSYENNYNLPDLPVDDDVSVIIDDGKIGLISYSGVKYASGYDEINVTTNNDILLGIKEYSEDGWYADENGNLYSLIGYKLSGDKSIEPCESFFVEAAGGEVMVWLDSRQHLYAVSTLITDMDAYSCNTETLGAWHSYKEEQVYNEYFDEWYDEYDFFVDGYVLVSNGQKVSDTIYENCGGYSDGIIAMKKGGKWGYVDKYGNTVIPFQYDGCWKCYDTSTASSSEDIPADELMPYPSTNGYVVVCMNNEYALLDCKGNTVITPGEFEAIRPVYEGKLWVQKDGLWGVIGLTKALNSDQTASAPTDKSIDAYKTKLLDIHDNPYNYLHTMMAFDIEEYCRFGIADINEDGVDELIVDFIDGGMSEMHMRVWRYDTASDNVVELAILNESCEFYLNNIVKSNGSHNHTMGDTIWPYTLFRWDPDQNGYAEVASAYCEDKSRSGENFPSALDSDRDGVLYYLTTDGSTSVCTREEYDDFVQEYIPDENRIDIVWSNITVNNIHELDQH